MIYVKEYFAYSFLLKFYSIQSFIFRFLIHFEFIFVYYVRECSNFILLPIATQFSQDYLLSQFSSVAQSCPTLCDPMDFKHTRLLCPSPAPRACSKVHRVGVAIQPSHPLSSPSAPVFYLSQQQGLS